MSPCKLCLLEVPDLAHLAKQDWGLCCKHTDALIKENTELKEQLCGVVVSEVVNSFISIFKR